jgi:hypothetical protein
MKKATRVGVILGAALGVAALASYLTTERTWDGGFPSGEVRIRVIDANGNPVKGAVLRVYHGGTRDLAHKCPLDNHLPGQELVSDDTGQMTALRARGGLQFGGRCWYLLWVIPIGTCEGPLYDCEITADGFLAIKFPIWRLFQSPHRSYEDFPKTKLRVEGKEIEVKVYEHTFALER